MPAMGKVTPGYCIPHDPGITLEMRQQFGAGKGLPRLGNKIKLSSAKDILEFVESLINDFSEKCPKSALTAEVIEVYANLARVALACVKEAGGKKSKKTLEGWRDVG